MHFIALSSIYLFMTQSPQLLLSKVAQMSDVKKQKKKFITTSPSRKTAPGYNKQPKNKKNPQTMFLLCGIYNRYDSEIPKL